MSISSTRRFIEGDDNVIDKVILSYPRRLIEGGGVKGGLRPKAMVLNSDQPSSFKAGSGRLKKGTYLRGREYVLDNGIHKLNVLQPF